MRAQARDILRILEPSLPTVRPKTPPDGKLREAIQSRAGRPDCFSTVLLAVTETRASSSSVASSFETPRNGAAPQDEVLDPHGEERGNAARLEPRGQGIRGHDQPERN